MGWRRRGVVVLLFSLCFAAPAAIADEKEPAASDEVTAEQRDEALVRMFKYLDDNLWKLGENGSTQKHYAAAVMGWASLICGEKIKDGKRLRSRTKQIQRARDHLAQYTERVARGYEQSDKRESKKKKDKPKGPPGFEGFMGMAPAQYVWSLGMAGHFHAESIARGKKKSAAKKHLRAVVKILQAAQQDDGGWGHDDARREGMGLPAIKIPKPGGGTLTYPGTLLGASNCALSALGAAHGQLGGKPTKWMKAGVGHFRKFQNGDGTWPYDPAQKHDRSGAGMPAGMVGGIEIARTSGGVLSMYLCGVPMSDEAIVKALEAIDAKPELLSDGHGSAGMALQFGALLAAARGGKAWATFRKIFFPKILAKQNADGSCDCVCSDAFGVTNDTKPIGGMSMPGWIAGGRVYITAIHALIFALDRAAPKAIPAAPPQKEKVVTR